MQRRIAYPKVAHPNELLVAQQKLILNIDTEATIIQQNWGDQLKSPEPGLYLRGSVKPLIRPGANYTDQDGIRTINLVNFDEFHDTLYHPNGMVAVSRFVMGNKKKYLTQGCTIPATAYQLVAVMVEQLIGTMNPWPNNQGRSDRAFSLIKHGSEELVTEEEFVPTILSKLFADVIEFIDGDNWHHYNVLLVGTGLVVEKLVDYRIYEWTRMVYEQQNPDPAD